MLALPMYMTEKRMSSIDGHSCSISSPTSWPAPLTSRAPFTFWHSSAWPQAWNQGTTNLKSRARSAGSPMRFQ